MDLVSVERKQVRTPEQMVKWALTQEAERIFQLKGIPTEIPVKIGDATLTGKLTVNVESGNVLYHFGDTKQGIRVGGRTIFDAPSDPKSKGATHGGNSMTGKALPLAFVSATRVKYGMKPLAGYEAGAKAAENATLDEGERTE